MLCCSRSTFRVDFGKVLGTRVTFFEREGFRFAAVGAFGLHAYPDPDLGGPISST
jgi:hypothetical protein